MDELSDQELFQSALSDDPIEAPVTEAEIEPKGDDRPRDEQGRFAAKSEEPEPEAPKTETQAAPEPPKETESVGVRQLREAFERQQRRNAELEQQLMSLRPKPEPAPKPDLFEKPDEFVRSNVQEALSPIEQRLSSAIELMSRNFAISQHGEERVGQAYSALDQAAKNGDPQALAVVNAVKQSMDPYGDIARWYSQQEANLNPQAFFQRQLSEALKDEKFKGELMQKLQPAQSETSPAKPVFRVPPSLNRATTAAPALDDGGDFSNESLFQNALR
jgi:hypothetical protein